MAVALLAWGFRALRAQSAQRSFNQLASCLIGSPLAPGETALQRVHAVRVALRREPPVNQSGMGNAPPAWPYRCADTAKLAAESWALSALAPELTAVLASAAARWQQHANDTESNPDQRAAADKEVAQVLDAARPYLDRFEPLSGAAALPAPASLLVHAPDARLRFAFHSADLRHGRVDAQPFAALTLTLNKSKSCEISAGADGPLSRMRCGTERKAWGYARRVMTRAAADLQSGPAVAALLPGAAIRVVDGKLYVRKRQGHQDQDEFLQPAGDQVVGDAAGARDVISCNAKNVSWAALVRGESAPRPGETVASDGRLVLFLYRIAEDGAAGPFEVKVERPKDDASLRVAGNLNGISLSCRDDRASLSWTWSGWHHGRAQHRLERALCDTKGCKRQARNVYGFGGTPLYGTTLGGARPSTPLKVEGPTLVDLFETQLLLYRTHGCLAARIATLEKLHQAPERLLLDTQRDGPTPADPHALELVTRDNVALLVVHGIAPDDHGYVFRLDPQGARALVPPGTASK